MTGYLTVIPLIKCTPTSPYDSHFCEVMRSYVRAGPGITSTTSPPGGDLTAEKPLQFLADILGLQDNSKRLRTEISITKWKKDVKKSFQKIVSGC